MSRNRHSQLNEIGTMGIIRIYTGLGVLMTAFFILWSFAT